MRGPWRWWRDRRAVSTRFGPARVFETVGPDGDDIRVLEVAGAFQSAAYADGRPDAPFAYLRAFDDAFDAGVPLGRALMLGGGAFACPRHLLARHGALRLDVVEVDPAIVALARERFFLADAERAHGDRLRVIVDDALVYLRVNVEAPGEAAGRVAYDLIMNDAFCGADPEEGLLAPEALALVRANLAPGGLYLANVVVSDSPAGGAALLEAGRALARSFAWVGVIPCADEGFSAQDNYLLAATDGPARPPSALPLPPD